MSCMIKHTSAIVPMFLIYYVVQKIYITTSREIQRLDSICKSPVMALFSESLGGLSTIRAYLKYISLHIKLFQSIRTITFLLSFLLISLNIHSFLLISFNSRWLGKNDNYHTYNMNILTLQVNTHNFPQNTKFPTKDGEVCRCEYKHLYAC